MSICKFIKTYRTLSVQGAKRPLYTEGIQKGYIARCLLTSFICCLNFEISTV